MRALLVMIAIVLAVPHAASAQAPGDVYDPRPTGKDIVVTAQGERSRNNILMLAALAGGGALLGGIGLYYHLDSQSAAGDVTADHFTNLPWGTAQQSAYDRAHSSATKAEIFYGFGGALLIGAIVAAIVTEPGTETTVIHPHLAPTVAPTPGGAVLGGTWSF